MGGVYAQRTAEQLLGVHIPVATKDFDGDARRRSLRFVNRFPNFRNV